MYGSGDGEMSMRYGWSSIYYPTHLNILYAEWYWDHEILGKIYDKLAVRNPKARGEYLPWMIETWDIGIWPKPQGGYGSKLRITLRPDIKWQDGTPLTIGDLYYTFAQVTPALIAKGYPPPWWYSAVQYLISCYIVDPYTIEMLFSVESVWIERWVLTAVPIIPRHIWKPIIEGGDPTLFQPDVDMIGSGPFKLVGYTPMASAELEANKEYFRYLPVDVNVHADDYKARFNLWHATCTEPPQPQQMLINFTITLHNLWLNASSGGTLIVDKFVSVDGIPETPVTGIPLYSCTPHPETVSKPLTRGRHNITVAVHVVGPPHMTYEGVQQDNPWVCQWINVTLWVWVTIVEDIVSTEAYWLPIFKNAGIQHPDGMIGLVDIYACAQALDSYPGHPKWNSLADVNGDYRVNMTDVNLIICAFSHKVQDIAITNVVVSKTVVCKGYPIKINVTITNQGADTQTFELSIRFNSSDVKTRSISLNAGNSTTINFSVIPRAFLFEEIWRESDGVSTGHVGDLTLTGTGTYLYAKTGAVGGSVPLPGGIIELYYSNGTLIRRLELLIAPDSTNTVFTAGEYGDGLYVIGANDGTLCILDDNGEYGEMSVGIMPVNDIQIEGPDITVSTTNEVIQLRRYSMGFSLPRGVYTVSAYVWPVIGELDTEDNTFTNGWVNVTATGDVTGPTPNMPDGVCDMRDVYGLVLKYMRPDKYDPNWDISDNGDIDMKDIYTAVLYFCKQDP
jgi:hypothetical protein